MRIRPQHFLLTAFALAFGWPVAADCDPAGPIDQALPAAPIAFVGTVTSLQGAVATFAVAEVWAGDVGSSVEIRGLSDGAAIGEDDRLWELGGTYLVLPIIDRGALRDHACTATMEWLPELERLRPEDALINASAAASESQIPIVLLAVSAVILLIGGASVLVFRRR